ncbi:MAG TPA: alpha/beta fold hydrolase [Rubrivivax sp.]|nr:alpha/beta fold hydrolase [Rubrivivax sp.]
MQKLSLMALPMAVLMAGTGAAPPLHAADTRPGLAPCWLQGMEHQALCDSVRRPLDPAAPQGTQIDVHFAVLPALARNRKPDPVFFFAGGPGQSAIEIAGNVARLLGRLSNRRDIVLVDQRGTGRSAPLVCSEPSPTQPLADEVDPARVFGRLADCRTQLQQLPHGDLRHYTTAVAMQDTDAVRRQLGADRVNLVGGSYGTRAALDYMRQFPQAVRRAVIDGVAPPDMVLPASFSTDNQAALEAVFAACESDTACSTRYPALRADWRGLLATLPRDIRVAHPVTGEVQGLTLSRDTLLGLVRAPLYVPALASALPLALTEAARGRFEPLVGLATALQGGRPGALAEGMHFSVVCAEDVPRLAQAADRPGADFGNAFADIYRKVCSDWPRGEVPAAFYTLPPAPAATLVLSGGADPVTPPRHGERTARALGAKARHVVVPEAGHGVMGLACVRDAVFRFIDADSDEEALQVDADCARDMPRPPAFVPITAATAEPAK